MSSPLQIVLVIPCFNESLRLPPFLAQLCALLEPLAETLTLQIADDGSSDCDQLIRVIETQRIAHPRLIAPALSFSHRGKGGTILEAWKRAPATTTHYGFLDADGAVPAEDVHRVLTLILSQADDRDTCTFAVRKQTKDTSIHRKWIRQVTGKIYYTLVNLLLGSSVIDPACGLKLLSQHFYRTVGSHLREQEWALDIEILARIEEHGYPLQEIPVNWSEKGGSKIVKMDLWRIFRQILAIRKRMLTWRAERLPSAP